MSDAKLSSAARRIVVAGETIAGGPRWQSLLSRVTGVSQSMLGMIASGERPVSPEVERRVGTAVLRESEIVRKRADRLKEIADRMLRGVDSG